MRVCPHGLDCIETSLRLAGTGGAGRRIWLTVVGWALDEVWGLWLDYDAGQKGMAAARPFGRLRTGRLGKCVELIWHAAANNGRGR